MIQEPNLTFVLIMNELYTFSHSILTYQGPQLWNELPQSIRESVSLNYFKCKLKYLLLNNIE